MKKTVLLGCVAALAMFAGGAMAQTAEVLSVSVECGAAPTMYRYDLPRDEDGVISAFDFPLDISSTTTTRVERELVLTDVVCLRDGESDQYVINMVGGPGISTPSMAVVHAIIFAMDAEVERALRVHAPNIFGAGS